MNKSHRAKHAPQRKNDGGDSRMNRLAKAARKGTLARVREREAQEG